MTLSREGMVRLVASMLVCTGLASCALGEKMTLYEALDEETQQTATGPAYEPADFSDEGLLPDEQRTVEKSRLLAIAEDTQSEAAQNSDFKSQVEELQAIADSARQNAQ
ncbi:hypothetical protein E1162_08775 [Rhodobacteraceae bacterium RKSG542]|uniref:hypothetical protein n=1 Tax=Pseudovibrio flavus TaxID=2529854 RepID=UPI0012BD57DC|nr:hypothetical protein [Pseudovibrio flavus]MTI17334.1 hypothetical protein [Pseudovibrio flavus]